MNFSISQEVQEGLPLYRIRHNGSSTSVAVLPEYGASWHEWRGPLQGQELKLIDNYTSKEHIEKKFTLSYKSAKLSPFVCRLNESSYTWEGVQFKADRFILNGHAIHGLLYDVPHEVMIAEASAFMCECKFLYKYKGTHPGFPFAFDMNVRFRLFLLFMLSQNIKSITRKK